MIFLNILTMSHNIMFILCVFSSFSFHQQDYEHFFFFFCMSIHKKGLFAETQKLYIKSLDLDFVIGWHRDIGCFYLINIFNDSGEPCCSTIFFNSQNMYHIHMG